MTTKERDAWTAAYRIYDEYAPKLRNADSTLAGEIFNTVGNRLNSLYNASDDGGRLILLSVYDILGGVFKLSQDRPSDR